MHRIFSTAHVLKILIIYLRGFEFKYYASSHKNIQLNNFLRHILIFFLKYQQTMDLIIRPQTQFKLLCFIISFVEF